ncbi:hypothetical protein D3C87_1966570 [compost metagenome]
MVIVLKAVPKSPSRDSFILLIWARLCSLVFSWRLSFSFWKLYTSRMENGSRINRIKARNKRYFRVRCFMLGCSLFWHDMVFSSVS